MSSPSDEQCHKFASEVMGAVERLRSSTGMKAEDVIEAMLCSLMKILLLETEDESETITIVFRSFALFAEHHGMEVNYGYGIGPRDDDDITTH